MLSRKCSRDEPVQNNRAFFNTIGQFRKSDSFRGRSVSPSTPDMRRLHRQVGFVPQPDIGSSFDHLVGELLQMQRYFETERLRGFEVDHQLELSRLLDWQIGRLRTTQDFDELPGN